MDVVREHVPVDPADRVAAPHTPVSALPGGSMLVAPLTDRTGDRHHRTDVVPARRHLLEQRPGELAAHVVRAFGFERDPDTDRDGHQVTVLNASTVTSNPK
jgi:hypothetical protein